MKNISTRLVGVAALGFVVGCSAGDPGGSSSAPFGNAGASGTAGAGGYPGTAGTVGVGGVAPMQMGNGPMAGRSGVTIPPITGVSSGGGTVGAGGLLGAGGITGIAGIPGAGMFGSGGTISTGGFMGVSGMFGSGGTLGMGGSQTGMAGASAGTTGVGGTSSGGDMETGRMVGMTAAHNAVRAAVMTTPALPPLTWSSKLAAYAQQWADSLAMTSCNNPHHRTEQELEQVGYGENLAAFTSSFGMSTAQQAVDGWAGEKSCYTFGAFMVTDKCDATCYMNMHSDGCGHYTQIVWRTSMQVGCGVSTCQMSIGGFSGNEDIWICNYAPPGNFVGQPPY